MAAFWSGGEAAAAQCAVGQAKTPQQNSPERADRFRALPTSNSKVAMMGMAANMYDVAISYEAGNISKAEFDQALRRTAIAQEQLDANQMQAENDTAASGRASLGHALQQMGESMRQDAQRRAAPSYRSTTKCTTQYIYGKYETVCR